MAKYARAVAGSLTAIVVFAALALGPWSLIKAKQSSCEQVNVLRGAIVTVLHNGETALAHNPYYKAHPDQLAAAEATYRLDTLRLQPVSC